MMWGQRGQLSAAARSLLLALAIASFLLSGCGDSIDKTFDEAVREKLATGQTGATTATGAGSTSSTNGDNDSSGESNAKDDTDTKTRKPPTRLELADQIAKNKKLKKGEITPRRALTVKVGDPESDIEKKLGSPIDVQEEQAPDRNLTCYWYQVITAGITIYCADSNGRVIGIEGR